MRRRQRLSVGGVNKLSGTTLSVTSVSSAFVLSRCRGPRGLCERHVEMVGTFKSKVLRSCVGQLSRQLEKLFLGVCHQRTLVEKIEALICFQPQPIRLFSDWRRKRTTEACGASTETQKKALKACKKHFFFLPTISIRRHQLVHLDPSAHPPTGSTSGETIFFWVKGW